jgi:hypothetical protein
LKWLTQLLNWCLIEGGTNPFSVTAPDVSIAKWKEAIQRKGSKIDLAAHGLGLNLIIYRDLFSYYG